MKTVISKTFEFDAGHRLSKGYVGNCSRPHGHRYKVELELSSTKLDRFDMIVDFNELKPFKQWLDSTFDHKFMIWVDDKVREELEMLFGAEAIVSMEQNPTAEHIAIVILAAAMQWPEWGSFVTAVTVWETPNSFARVEVK